MPGAAAGDIIGFATACGPCATAAIPLPTDRNHLPKDRILGLTSPSAGDGAKPRGDRAGNPGRFRL